jgi:hypothetical protein
MSEELLVPDPRTGEALDVKTAPTDTLADLHDLIAGTERDLKSHRRTVDDELVTRMDHEGLRTYHGEGYTVETSKPTERQWDTALLMATLDRLVGDGILSARKAEKCIKTELKVVAMEVRPLESDPRTKRQIAACYSEVPAHRSVRVKR